MVMIQKIPAVFLVERFGDNSFFRYFIFIGCHIFPCLCLPQGEKLIFFWQRDGEHFLHVAVEFKWLTSGHFNM